MCNLKKYINLIQRNNDVIAALVFILFFIATVYFDRRMDLAFGIISWEEIMDSNLSYQQIFPYWDAMWNFYYVSILILLTLASRSLIPMIWGLIVQHFAIEDMAYFVFNNLNFPENFNFLRNNILIGLSKILGFEMITLQTLLISSVIGIILGVFTTFIYIKVKKMVTSRRH